MSNQIKTGDIVIGRGAPLVLISGPCVIENYETTREIAGILKEITSKLQMPFIFKASYDKANRSSVDAYRGPGLEKGLEVLAEIKEKLQVPILTDVHRPEDVARVAEVADVLQIPAFLCRQTDLILAAAATGRVINLKKGQFLAPEAMQHVVKKLEHGGCRKIILTERGASFGYNNLVADMRSLLIMRQMGYPVIFDATHSVQRPGGGESFTGGDGQWAPALARAAVATGCDGVFLETHVNPAEALSDRENAVPLSCMRALWRQLRGIDEVVS